MSIVGGLDIHRKQLTFDYLDTVSGEARRGQIAPADRAHLRAWLARFAGRDDTLVGAWAISPLAGERIHTAAMAIRHHLPIDVLAGSIAQYPHLQRGHHHSRRTTRRRPAPLTADLLGHPAKIVSVSVTQDRRRPRPTSMNTTDDVWWQQPYRYADKAPSASRAARLLCQLSQADSSFRASGMT